MPEPCLRMRTVGDMLDGAPAGQREAARRALQAKGIEMLADSLVTSVERLSQAGSPAAHSTDSDAGRRLVCLKSGGKGPEVPPGMCSLISGFSNLPLCFLRFLHLCCQPFPFASHLHRFPFQRFQACSWLVLSVSLY